MSIDDEPYDAVIVGGGVNGILLALEGAARDQRILLVERDDFGSGASANHLRTIHGGLRYLQSLDLRRSLDSNYQRQWWLRHFPDLVRPVLCLLPLYGDGLRRKSVFRIGFMAARALGLHRNPTAGSSRMEVVTNAEVLRLAPCCRRESLDGGALWQDAFMDRPHRVIAELLHWAESAGVVVRNKTAFVSARRNADGRWTATLRDHRSNRTAVTSTRAILNAAGSDIDRVLRTISHDAMQPMLVSVLAWALLLDRAPSTSCSVGVSAAGGQTWFLHPYHGRLLAGIGLAGVPIKEPSCKPIDRPLLDRSLEELNEALPGADFTHAEIRHVFAGVLPGVSRGSKKLLLHSRIVDHAARDGLPDIWTVLGVKFTEAPLLAERFWDARLGRRSGDLPQRPAPKAVPTIEEARSMPDAELRRRLNELAESEWNAGPEDVLWRRTDLWMDQSVSERAAALLHTDDGRL